MLFQAVPKTLSSTIFTSAVRRLSQSPVNNSQNVKLLASVVFYSLATLGVANVAEKTNKAYLFKQLGN
ncbi:hypothetical protein SBY92_004240 [Candida maltosa Xu316]|uniref:Uncharacterized protein n=1 Tax=Candida maltosa (strain Xu316) TaxID=1245528 RepID=M3K2L8_CANMX|nr:hypothetical protein G210_0339 [Candida maltosa Xu316]